MNPPIHPSAPLERLRRSAAARIPDLTGPEMRRIVLLALAVWGAFAAMSLMYAWEGLSDRPAWVWRPLAADASGALYSIIVAFFLRTTAPLPPAGRLGIAALACLVASFFYAVTALILIAPFEPYPENMSTAMQVVQLTARHYWIFLAFAGFHLLLDGGAGASWAGLSPHADAERRAIQQEEAIRQKLAAGLDSYEGLDARWFWTFQAVFWTLMLVFSTGNMINTGGSVSDTWRIGFAELVGLGSSAAAHYLALRPTRSWTLYSRAALALAIAIVLAGIYVFAIWLSWWILYPAPEDRSDASVFQILLYMTPRLMFLNFPVFVGWSGFYLALDAARRMRRQERQLFNSMLLAQEAQLKMLRFQLNPHFLFNTLNAISTLVLDRRNDEAEAMLMRLGRFLRFTLDASPDDRVRLEDELAAQKLYLAIEETRFPERLQPEFDISPATLDALVPTLILQPLTENAVKYAVSRTLQPVHLVIRARRVNDRLEIEVCDDGPGVPAGDSGGGAGVGLRNIEARLGVLYGEDASIEAGTQAQGGFRVRLVMPFEPAEAGGEE